MANPGTCAVIGGGTMGADIALTLARAGYTTHLVETFDRVRQTLPARLAAGLASVAASANFDPIAENWLNAPMDFENEVLANELRMKLMTEAALTEQDLRTVEDAGQDDGPAPEPSP